MGTAHSRRPLVAALQLALALAGGAAHAQTSSTDDGMARAQRAADRVKELILQSAQIAGSGVSGARPGASASAPAPGHMATANARPGRAIAPPPVRAPAPVRSAAAAATPPSAATVVSAPAPAAAAARADVLEVAVTAPPRPRQPVVLFDFEASAVGFELHRAADWRLGDPEAFELTPGTSHGQSALQVRAAEDSWFGVELTEAVDFTAVHRFAFYLRSARGAPARFAVKTGSQYDWCELRPVAKAAQADMVRYEVDLKAVGGRDCRNLDLEDVRGLQWGLRGGDTVVLDEVELM